MTVWRAGGKIIRSVLCSPIVCNNNQAQSEYKHLLANISRSRYVAIATQTVHRLQIRPTVHNQGASPTTPPSYIWVRAILWAWGCGQIDTQTHTYRHTEERDHNTFRMVGYTTHAKCNNVIICIVHSAMHTHMNRPNSCLLVRFSFSVVIGVLCVTVCLCQVQLSGIIVCYSLCMCAFVLLDLVSSVLCQEIGQEECLRK